ncbi:hypothetical protein D3C87_2025430 [compost metagenome]
MRFRWCSNCILVMKKMRLAGTPAATSFFCMFILLSALLVRIQRMPFGVDFTISAHISSICGVILRFALNDP